MKCCSERINKDNFSDCSYREITLKIWVITYYESTDNWHNHNKTKRDEPYLVGNSALLVTLRTLGLYSFCHRLPLRWRHNGHDDISNHQPHHSLLNGLFGHRSNKTSKLRVTDFCAGNSPGCGEFPTQMASNAENVSIWWRHHVCIWI